MEVTINYNGQAVAVEVTLEVYEFLDRADHKTENLFHEQRRHWDGREFDEYIITTEGVGAYGETPEEYLCRMETLHELMAVLDTCTEAQREMENYERRKVYHRAYYSLDAYSWMENYALEHSRSPEDILLEREEMTTRLHLIAALPVALAHATPTQARCVHAYYSTGIKQPKISRREGVHSSKVSVAIRRGLRNMRRCYDDLFQTE